MDAVDDAEVFGQGVDLCAVLVLGGRSGSFVLRQTVLGGLELRDVMFDELRFFVTEDMLEEIQVRGKAWRWPTTLS